MLKIEIKPLYILLLSIVTFAFANCIHSNSKGKKQPAGGIKTSLDSSKVEKNISSCCQLNIDTIRHYFQSNDVTSGTMNKPDLLSDYNLGENRYYGFYNLVNRESELKPPVVAQVLVSFEKKPWNYSDKNQELIILIVKDKLFKCNPFSFSVGDSLKRVNNSFAKVITIGEIQYYRKGNCLVGIKLKGEIISKYILWPSDFSDSEIQHKHSIVENYLK